MYSKNDTDTVPAVLVVSITDMSSGGGAVGGDVGGGGRGVGVVGGGVLCVVCIITLRDPPEETL